MFRRIISPLKTYSFFLFGARGTGKSTFLRSYFQGENVLWFDLLDPEKEDLLERHPNALTEEIAGQKEKPGWVVIDEVQKIPKLLDLVHQLIETSHLKFALTGSSARKLKRGGANLLAGRAFVNHLFPLTHVEMGEEFNLTNALHWGTLPKISQLHTDEEKNDFLRAYALTYLKEEVWAEHFIRELPPFRKFLEVAAQTNSEIVNYTNIAKDVGADVKTVQSYFEILEDTLLGFLLEPYHRSIRKQQRKSPKFYFFDVGVKRALDRTLPQQLLPQTSVYGKAFEHFLMIEIHRLNTYLKKDFRLSYLLTKDGAEIDLIMERPGAPTALVEIKSSEHVDERDTRIVQSFLKDFEKAQAYVLSRDPRPKKIGDVYALPWQEGLQEIGLTP
ncbi:MAG: ATP-binding protein [Deltaproteobacteria bacterium]|nr:ATP-binding protein [Deltaproteobacteria bacterium]